MEARGFGQLVVKEMLLATGGMTHSIRRDRACLNGDEF
jgi:hypothetical protein